MRKIVKNREFDAIEVHKMYDDESIICDLINETAIDNEETKEEIQQGIGFVKEVWQEFVSFTKEEMEILKPTINESDTVVE